MYKGVFLCSTPLTIITSRAAVECTKVPIENNEIGIGFGCSNKTGRDFETTRV